MPNKIKFGYLVPTRDAVMRAPDGRADIRRMLDLAVKSEQMGYDSLWIGDSLLARPRFEALTTLAAISSLTKKIEMGTAVYITPLRHPVPLAHTVGNDVERRYRRGDQLEKRRDMMTAWSNYLNAPPGGNVTPMRSKESAA